MFISNLPDGIVRGRDVLRHRAGRRIHLDPHLACSY
jgi:hypothetical protein